MSIEVTIQYDPGDWSVGIGPGWGEETGAVEYLSPQAAVLPQYRISWCFDVQEEQPVAEWPLQDIQLAMLPIGFARDDYGAWIFIAQGEVPKAEVDRRKDGKPIVRYGYRPPQFGGRQARLGDFPHVCSAVEAEWERVCAEQRAAIEAENAALEQAAREDWA